MTSKALMLCIFSSDQSISNFISPSLLLLLLLHESQEQSAAFAKLMKVEAFMPMEMGSMGNVPSVIIWLHLRLNAGSDAAVLAPAPRSGPRFDDGSGVKSWSWMKGGAPLRDKSLQLPNWVADHLANFAAQFQKQFDERYWGCLPNNNLCSHKLKHTIRDCLSRFVLRKMFSG